MRASDKKTKKKANGMSFMFTFFFVFCRSLALHVMSKQENRNCNFSEVKNSTQ